MEYEPTRLRRCSQRGAFPSYSQPATERRASRTSFVTFRFWRNLSSSAIWKAPWQKLWHVKLHVKPDRRIRVGLYQNSGAFRSNLGRRVAGCLLWVMGCRRASVGITTGVPQIAADLVQRPG